MRRWRCDVVMQVHMMPTAGTCRAGGVGANWQHSGSSSAATCRACSVAACRLVHEPELSMVAELGIVQVLVASRETCKRSSAFTQSAQGGEREREIQQTH